MDIEITDLTVEEHNKIMEFAKQQVKEKFILTIFYDTCDNTDMEKSYCFDNEKIEDVKIMNNLKDYYLCKEFETEFDVEEMKKEGYFLFYIESYIHSGITLYEFDGALKDRWDSGIAGIVAIKSKDFKIAYESFKNFIKLWNKINNGEFYGYRIVNNFGEDIDCCGGFWELEDLRESLPDYITEEQFNKAKENILY